MTSIRTTMSAIKIMGLLGSLRWSGAGLEGVGGVRALGGPDSDDGRFANRQADQNVEDVAGDWLIEMSRRCDSSADF
jgi:hypothetical protein